MRLTLRTLLAYLDDTLEPTEIKQIGQKVAESDAAQELIARIKQVTRRRRLTTPPATGPGARFDPNTVAEYLDNELPAEQMAELEKTCLESDVHLAEVAACHQILTLVLGEPALVPPTAKERMYGLVRGREAIHSRKASPVGAGAGAGEGDSDADDTFLLGLPFYRKHGPLLRWALPLAGVFLLVALGVALWLAMPRPKPSTRVVAADTKKEPDKAPVEETKKPADTKPPDAKPPETRVGDTKPPDPKPNDTKSGETKPDDTKVEGPPPDPTVVVRPSKEPSPERILAGSYFRGGDPSVLLRPVQAADGSPAGYERLVAGASVYTTDRLMSLPGYLSELRLKSGANLVLRGSVPQFARTPEMTALLESVVTLHKPPRGIDLELTYHRGRIYLANHKKEGAVVVRLRFGRDRAGGRGEVWDLKLQEPDTEVGIDFIKAYTRDVDYKSGEGPRFELYLCVLKGRVSLKSDPFNDPQYLAAPPGPALVVWDNKGRGVVGPLALGEVPPVWQKQPPTPKQPEREQEVENMKRALIGLNHRLVRRPLEPLVWEALDGNVWSRKLAIYTLGALDDVRKLIDILGDESPDHAPDREQAIETLRRWLGRNADQGKLLYNPGKDVGILVDAKYKSKQAETILELLHDFPDALRGYPETFDRLAKYLEDRTAIAELGWYHLRRLAYPVPLPPFNAAAALDKRERVAEEIRRMIRDKQLPPREDKSKEPMPPKKRP